MIWWLTLVPVALWGIHWYFDRRVVWQEALMGTAFAVVVAGVFELINSGGAFVPMDQETWSGQVNSAHYRPKWREKYKEAIYRTETYTTGSGKNRVTHTRRVFSHYETRYRWHPDRWFASTTLGETTISQVQYGIILKAHGKETKKKGSRSTWETGSHMVEGDPYDYQTKNITDYLFPICTDRKFENRLLKAHSLYDFTPVTPEEAAKLPEWPKEKYAFNSGRLIGSAGRRWNLREWDQMNARLGPTKKVNVIAVGFPKDQGEEWARLLERYWKGGKKNDLVLCYGDSWVYCFGWTEKNSVKRLLENRLRSGDDSIQSIEQLIRDEYELFHFEDQFHHLKIEPPAWFYFLFVIVLAGSQVGLHWCFTQNDVSRNSRSEGRVRPKMQRRWRSRYPGAPR